MRHQVNTSLFRCLSLIVALAIFCYPIIAFAVPTTSHLHSSSFNNETPTFPELDIRSPQNHRSVLIAHNKRLFTIRQKIGLWNVILTASETFWPTQRPANQVAAFLGGVANLANTYINSGTPEHIGGSFDKAGMSFKFSRMSMGVTMPWALIAEIANDFEDKARKGFPLAMIAQLTDGPGGGWIQCELKIGPGVGTTLASANIMDSVEDFYTGAGESLSWIMDSASDLLGN